MKAKIANAVVRGQLDASPFLQGILLRMIRKLDKDRRGVSMRGQPAFSTPMEHQLMEDAAFSFAMAGKNTVLAQMLGQRARPEPIVAEKLPAMGLPDPTLALRKSEDEKLRNNLLLVHQKFSMASGQSEKRLVLSIDHTYLSRRLLQAQVGGQYGLVGAPWQPVSEEDKSFMNLRNLPSDATKTAPAPLMFECLCWHPCESVARCLSIASAPMALKAAVPSSSGRSRNLGKWVACRP